LGVNVVPQYRHLRGGFLGLQSWIGKGKVAAMSFPQSGQLTGGILLLLWLLLNSSSNIPRCFDRLEHSVWCGYCCAVYHLWHFMFFSGNMRQSSRKENFLRNRRFSEMHTALPLSAVSG
jgi:hypothetical protein